MIWQSCCLLLCALFWRVCNVSQFVSGTNSLLQKHYITSVNKPFIWVRLERLCLQHYLRRSESMLCVWTLCVIGPALSHCPRSGCLIYWRLKALLAVCKLHRDTATYTSPFLFLVDVDLCLTAQVIYKAYTMELLTVWMVFYGNVKTCLSYWMTLKPTFSDRYYHRLSFSKHNFLLSE